MSFHSTTNEIINTYWNFLESDWPTITRTKFHRTEIRDVKEIDYIRRILIARLGAIPIFFFLVILFGTRDYPGPYKNIHKGLLVLFHLVKGLSLNDMSKYIPKSTFNEILHRFYYDQCQTLDQRTSFYMERMFSNTRLRILQANEKNPVLFKHVTLFLDGHDTRGIVENGSSVAYYSYKLKKSGFRTQVVSDINNMVLFVSKSYPCAVVNDGNMFVDMNVGKIMSSVECMAVDGGYTLKIPDAVAESKLNKHNFSHPFRKAKDKELSDSEKTYNEQFGSFRSQIESLFAELGNTFERLNNTKYIKLGDDSRSLDVFNIQLKLGCLLLNIKKFVELKNIHVEPGYVKFMQKDFDYPDDDDDIREELNVNQDVKSTIEIGEQLQKLQQEYLDNSVIEIQNDEIEMQENNNIYHIEKILNHRGDGSTAEYFVKWAGFRSENNSWVTINSFIGTEMVDKYWKKVNGKKRARKV
jgi:hypothetical protein